MHFKTDFLFARPSFLEGTARILDFGNVLNTYNCSPTPELADYFKALVEFPPEATEQLRSSAACAFATTGQQKPRGASSIGPTV